MLPGGPRMAGAAPRSRSVGRTNPRPRNDYADEPVPRASISSQASGAGRSIRTQRSMGNLPASSGQARGRAPPMPRLETSRAEYDPPLRKSASSGSSTTSSMSSSGSSFLDRMRVRSNDTTPRTSIDEEDYRPSHHKSSKSSRDAQSLRREGRSRRWRDDDGRSGAEDGEVATDVRLSYPTDLSVQDQDTKGSSPIGTVGASVWGYVTTAAGNLTVNVSQAWATKIAVYAGEATPPGEESRLTRAMKAYHLEKARHPSDLPDWLFDASERSAGRRQGRGKDEYYEREEPVPAPAERSRGLRDIYETARARSPNGRLRDDRPTQRAPVDRYAHDGGAGGGGGTSKASDRLKAMRDAKRQAASRNAGGGGYAPEEAYDGRGQDRERPASRAPRMGLPSGPGGRVARR